MKRAVFRDKKKEQALLEKCTVSESGLIIYPGTGDEEKRTGSPVKLLIDWYLYQEADEKPMDADIFKDFINGKLTI